MTKRSRTEKRIKVPIALVEELCQFLNHGLTSGEFFRGTQSMQELSRG